MMPSDEQAVDAGIRHALSEHDYHRAYTLMEGFADRLKADRDRLAERVKELEYRIVAKENACNDICEERDSALQQIKELESWIDKGESPMLHEARQALLREGMARNEADAKLKEAEADNAALLRLITESVTKFEALAMPTSELQYELNEIVEELGMVKYQPHPGTALKQRLAEMEKEIENWKTIVRDQCEQEEHMRKVLEAYDSSSADGVEPLDSVAEKAVKRLAWIEGVLKTITHGWDAKLRQMFEDRCGLPEDQIIGATVALCWIEQKATQALEGQP